MIMELITGAGVTTVLALGGWVFNAHSRVVKVETQFIDLKELIQLGFTHQDQRLQRIEKALNGNLWK